jgi:hypothetical protein
MNSPTIPFDTLRFANSLKEVGVPVAQAERQAELMAETINNELASKKDIKELEMKIEQTKRDIIIWLGGIIVVVVGIAVEVLGFIIKLR